MTADYADPICREESGNSARIDVRLRVPQIAEPCRSCVNAKQHSAWNLLAKLTREQYKGQKGCSMRARPDKIFKVRIDGKQKTVE